jgi:hypothetical protein
MTAITSRIGQATRGATKADDVSPWIEPAARFGYVVRGVLYMLVGGLAVAVATQQGGAVTNPKGAIATIAGLPFGRILLLLIVTGLAGYSLWGFVRAFFDPLQRGHDASGLLQRGGYLVSAFVYASLIPFTAQLIAGAHPDAGGGVPFTARVLALPAGPWIVGAVGVGFVIGAGFGQFYEAFTAKFKKDFESWHMSHDETGFATRLGRLGHAARGVVFTLIGLFIVQSAHNSTAYENTGLDGALAALAAQPFGPYLLGVVAAGLFCFGLFSLGCARWFKI